MTNQMKVEEARAVVRARTPKCSDRACVVCPAIEAELDALIEAVRRQERERVTHELENHRWAGGGAGCSVCARSSEEAGG